jgi:hypothetical protein
MTKTDDAVLREQLTALLKGGQAHATFSDAVAHFPEDRISDRPAGTPYSAWQLVEHIRITLHDLLEFVTNSEYVEIEWPSDYWPRDAAPGKGESWNATVKAVHADLKSFESLIHSPAICMQRFPGGRMARHCSVRYCWRQTTPATTWAS